VSRLETSVAVPAHEVLAPPKKRTPIAVAAAVVAGRGAWAILTACRIEHLREPTVSSLVGVVFALVIGMPVALVGSLAPTRAPLLVAGGFALMAWGLGPLAIEGLAWCARATGRAVLAERDRLDALRAKND
jgi:hypothetical protein